MMMCVRGSPSLHIAAFLSLPLSALGCVNRYVSVCVCVCVCARSPRPSVRRVGGFHTPARARRRAARSRPSARPFWPFVNFRKVYVRRGGGDGNAVRDLAPASRRSETRG